MEVETVGGGAGRAQRVRNSLGRREGGQLWEATAAAGGVCAWCFHPADLEAWWLLAHRHPASRLPARVQHEPGQESGSASSRSKPQQARTGWLLFPPLPPPTTETELGVAGGGRPAHHLPLLLFLSRWAAIARGPALVALSLRCLRADGGVPQRQSTHRAFCSLGLLVWEWGGGYRRALHRHGVVPSVVAAWRSSQWRVSRSSRTTTEGSQRACT